MAYVTDEKKWYVQKGARVQGPYSIEEVNRFFLLGRVRNTDRVSCDGELWEPVTQVPELIPEEMLDLESDHRGNFKMTGYNAVVEEKISPSEKTFKSGFEESLLESSLEEARQRGFAKGFAAAMIFAIIVFSIFGYKAPI